MSWAPCVSDEICSSSHHAPAWSYRSCQFESAVGWSAPARPASFPGRCRPGSTPRGNRRIRAAVAPLHSVAVWEKLRPEERGLQVVGFLHDELLALIEPVDGHGEGKAQQQRQQGQQGPFDRGHVSVGLGADPLCEPAPVAVAQLRTAIERAHEQYEQNPFADPVQQFSGHDFGSFACLTVDKNRSATLGWFTMPGQSRSGRHTCDRKEYMSPVWNG